MIKVPTPKPQSRAVRVEEIAAEVKRQLGDQLISVNNNSARELRLEQIRELFRKDGQQYALELRRGVSNIRVDLRTRRLL